MTSREQVRHTQTLPQICPPPSISACERRNAKSELTSSVLVAAAGSFFLPPAPPPPELDPVRSTVEDERAREEVGRTGAVDGPGSDSIDSQMDGLELPRRVLDGGYGNDDGWPSADSREAGGEGGRGPSRANELDQRTGVEMEG